MTPAEASETAEKPIPATDENFAELLEESLGS